MIELHAKQAKERASEIQKNQKAIEKDFEEEEEQIMKAVEADMENKRGSVQGGGFQQRKPKPKPYQQEQSPLPILTRYVFENLCC